MNVHPRTFVLYHGHCYDGFGAAWAAWTVLGENAVYLPMQYGQPWPREITVWDDVYILDFSFPRSLLEDVWTVRTKIISRPDPGRVVLLDHHKTAAEDLAHLPFANFDLNKSGAVLAWEYWHPGEPVPFLLQYVQDRDLWQFALPKSREISAALRSYPFDFAVWDQLARQWDFGRLVLEGEIILRYQNQLVETMGRNARLVSLAGHLVPVVNTPILISEMGDWLLEHYPHPFAATYFDRGDGVRQWSLRSRTFDVAALARRLGGGGHPRAAGFEEDL